MKRLLVIAMTAAIAAGMGYADQSTRKVILPVNKTAATSGQQMYSNYCAPCHGLDGYGHGPINERAQELQVKSEAQWSPAADLHGDTIRGRADGHLYNTINNGIRNMPGYGAQIPVADRWAIVAYLRALQLSQHAPADSVPPGKLK